MSTPIQRSLVFIFCLIISLPLWAAASPQLPGKPDVRLIIDISGSMKRNDPHNLRRPAVRMVSQLLPAGSHAGVWTFGREVNMLVPHGRVDRAWRKNASRLSERINSVGLYTNIGKALEVASDDFRPGRRFDNTHFILLTDGMVDLPGGQVRDEVARHRILTRLLDRIKSHGAHIDTIALSGNADRGLLKRLAVATGGLFTVATTADQLSRAFLNAFDKAAPSSQVPLTDNRFKVDQSIREFTALVFHKPDSRSTHLVPPNGRTIGPDTHNGRVHWLHEENYDLVTVERPMAGNWQVDAQLRPNSRVTVVSNLRMAVSDLPANFYQGDHLDLGVSFFDKKSRITNKDFLRLIKVDVSISDSSGRSGTKTISDPNKVPDDGVYHAPINRLSVPGVYRVKVRADGKTFQREQTQTITLRPPVDVEVQGQGTGDQSRYLLTVTPLDPKLDPHKTRVAVRYQAPGGQASVQTLDFDSQYNQWRDRLSATAGPGRYKVEVRVKGESGQGQVLDFSPEPFYASYPRQQGKIPSFVDLSAGKDSLKATSAPAKVAQEPVKAVPRPTGASSAPPSAAKTAARTVPSKTSVPVAPNRAEPKPATSEASSTTSGTSKGGYGWLIGIIVGIIMAAICVGLGLVIWRKQRAKRAALAESGSSVPETDPETVIEEPAGSPVEIEVAEEEPALEPLDEVPGSESDQAPQEAAHGAQEETERESTETEDHIPVMEDTVSEAAPEEVAADSGDLEADAVPEQGMADPDQKDEDDDYSLEDFDIGEVDDLPEESGAADQGGADRNRKDEAAGETDGNEKPSS